MPAQLQTQIADTFEYAGEETVVSMGKPSPSIPTRGANYSVLTLITQGREYDKIPREFGELQIAPAKA